MNNKPNPTLMKYYNKIPTSVFKGSYVFFAIIMIISWVFTIIQAEELILLCTNNQTILQYLFTLDYTACGDNKFTNNSIIFTVGSFVYGLQSAFIAGYMRQEYKKRLLI